MTIDSKSRIYFGDISRGSIDYVTPDEDYLNLRLLVRDPRIVWPDGLCFGTDGKLHFFSSQLNRSAVYNGKSAPTAPFQIFKIRGEAEGIVGR
jgi:sugar lactone lactonase YvrE